MGIALEVDQSKFNRLVKFFPEKVKTQWEDDLDYIPRKFLKEFRAKRLRGKPGIQAYPGGIFTTFKRMPISGKALTDMGVRIFTESPVAVQHEKGGIIKSLTGGKIPIPISSAQKTQTDVFTKKSGQVRKRYKKDIGKIKGLFKITTKKDGKEILFRRVKGQSQTKRYKDLIAMFVLKDSITLEDRLKYFVVWDDLSPIFLDRINKGLDKVLESL